ncbi:hypothetical protein KCP91_12180 [Microvirga sp. SRT01]|uniref:Uncharacterized protein n=1 Tax=Sphingomonas longa TaxID=2778730 RepID=A0ABS2D878_9SPHN|nr:MULTISPECIES: hypothetical protein [Alphaproteobacteria]MBM6577131.1 hypothetical protein [Sphingomonas sp. BT552]MBR7710175.1 hypothetical protein [Microvirga sp. SRT01]
MLIRIENAYLGILRIVVLVVASVALVVAAIAFMMSIPPLARQFGLVSPPVPHGGTLGDYVEQKKATAPANPTASGDREDAAQPKRSTNPDVQAAAKQLQAYTKGAGEMTIPKWEVEVEQSGGNIPYELERAYYADVKGLTDQLTKSTGKRLSLAQVRELITWNNRHFVGDATAKAEEAAAQGRRALFTLYVASAAFVLFILVVFTFLFVKVERSLRVVRTVRLEDQNA